MISGLGSQASDSWHRNVRHRTGEEMSKEQKKEEERFIYKKDPELGKANIAVFELAKNLEAELKQRYPEPQYRVRTRLRSRTQLWDVVVKVRTSVKPEPAAKAA